jgi:hypothetical protein
VAIDEERVSLPQLYGAPAYARPAPVVDETQRPFDKDDLPIEAIQTQDERELARSLPAGVHTTGGLHQARLEHASRGEPSLQARPLSLRALAGRILGQIAN